MNEKTSPGLLFLRGVLAVLFGLVAVAWPGITTYYTVLFLGLFLLIDGVVATIFGFANIKKEQHWYVMVLVGLLSIFVGVLILQYEALSLVTIAMVFGIFAIAKGCAEIIYFFQHHKELDHKVLLILAGIINILFGMILVVQPIVSSIVYVWVIGLTALLVGTMYIVMSISLKLKGGRSAN